MAQHAEVLVKSNHLTERIVVIPGKVEEVLLPEQVDIIISEPVGYMLFNEHMLESYLHAKKYLRPGGGGTCSPPLVTSILRPSRMNSSTWNSSPRELLVPAILPWSGPVSPPRRCGGRVFPAACGGHI